MILGVGVDICSIARIQRKVNELGSHFYNLILTENEIEQCKLDNDFILSLTYRFATKEAFYKAFDVPKKKLLMWKELEVLKNKFNMHEIKLLDNTNNLFEEFLPSQSKYNISNSIAIIKEFVICKVIITYYKC